MTVLPAAPVGPLRLVPMQRLTNGGRWRTEAMRSYRMPVLLWFTRGQGRITVAGRTRGYGAHNAVYVPPRTMHGFEVAAQVFGTAIFFNEASGFEVPDVPCHLRIRDARAQGEISSLLEQLQREVHGDRPLKEQAIAHYGGLLGVWLQRQRDETEAEEPESPAMSLVRRFTEAVENQLYTGQSISDYAELLGVTPTHLSRVCNQTCGRPASELLADRLTFEARRLLLDTSLPIKRVAEVLGYNSAAYFTRAFHNRTGQTPSDFRDARRA
ncbi:AraC-like DNA-binding protein [Aliiruegeria haliotis]|uniref:AraC-like DNA-binding protein n=1 Tax=Aliiruegeria haliotis TaxID=1280846 RepID=A0A2T0RZN5_9RHOB|nr:AraC family transcriptional regulator [Aliiruegeria haliotis]PRY26639.1 AraC-like DNA-binding protein [Aliiruegeria haliotis]